MDQNTENLIFILVVRMCNSKNLKFIQIKIFPSGYIFY
jgi:hypothetical protein